MKESRNLDKAQANGGYLWIENSFVEKILPELSGQAARVYLFLVRNAPQGKRSDPITRRGLSASKIGEALNRDRTSIVPVLKELEKLGAIEKVMKPGRPSRYRLLETCRENPTGGDGKTPQGYRENPTPPEDKTPQVDDAEPYGTGAGGSPKSSKSILRAFKKTKGLKPIQQPSGCGPRKV